MSDNLRKNILSRTRSNFELKTQNAHFCALWSQANFTRAGVNGLRPIFEIKSHEKKFLDKKIIFETRKTEY